MSADAPVCHHFWLPVLLVLAAASALPAFPWPRQIKAQRLPVPSDALSLAVADCRNLSPEDRYYSRYIWLPRAAPDDLRALSFTMNVVSRSNTIRRPIPIGAGPLMAVRIDLRQYAPRHYDLKEWMAIWEDFQFDPKFSLLITQGMLKIAGLTFPGLKARGLVRRMDWVKTPSEPFVHTDGKKYDWRWSKHYVNRVEEVNLSTIRDIDLIRLVPHHLDRGAYMELCAMTNSHAPIINQDYFAYRALKSVEDKGVYATIYGGRYYQLAGIKKDAGQTIKAGPQKGKKATDEDVLLEDLGIGSTADGLTAEVIFERLRSDQRAAIFRSGVTGRPRQMQFFRSLVSRLDVGTGLVSVTRDLGRQDIDIDVHPAANLLDFRHRATEVIWERSNGFHGYSLYAGPLSDQKVAPAGSRQNTAPSDVASDRTVPAPHSTDLEPALSCIACHENEGSDGWKRVTNDVKRLVAGKGKIKLDIFGDVSRLRSSQAELVDRLWGLYSGDPERALQRGRDDYAAAVLRAVGPMKGGKGDQSDVVKLASTRVVDSVRKFAYDLVDTRQALAEMGLKVDDPKQAQAMFERLTNPDPRLAVPGPGEAIIPETLSVGAIRAGIGVDRFDWDLSYSYNMARVQRSLAGLRN